MPDSRVQAAWECNLRLVWWELRRSLSIILVIPTGYCVARILKHHAGSVTRQYSNLVQRLLATGFSVVTIFDPVHCWFRALKSVQLTSLRSIPDLPDLLPISSIFIWSEILSPVTDHYWISLLNEAGSKERRDLRMRSEAIYQWYLRWFSHKIGINTSKLVLNKIEFGLWEC